jgi:hypothetical protein
LVSRIVAEDAVDRPPMVSRASRTSPTTSRAVPCGGPALEALRLAGAGARD